MAACPMKDKKRVTLLYILSVLVLLLSFVGLAYAYQAGSYTDDDFKRQITVDFAGGKDSILKYPDHQKCTYQRYCPRCL